MGICKAMAARAAEIRGLSSGGGGRDEEGGGAKRYEDMRMGVGYVEEGGAG